MLAASGGALLFGGMRRILRAVRLAPSLLMAIGILILANTRPFEGLLTCIPVAGVLVTWLIRTDAISRATKVRLCVLPVAVVLMTGVVCMGLYNRAVTGAFTTRAYEVHLSQDWNRGPFVFSRLREPQRTPTERLAAFYRHYESPSLSVSGFHWGHSRELRRSPVGIDRRGFWRSGSGNQATTTRASFSGLRSWCPHGGRSGNTPSW